MNDYLTIKEEVLKLIDRFSLSYEDLQIIFFNMKEEEDELEENN
jgi:hypothetical protein